MFTSERCCHGEADLHEQPASWADELGDAVDLFCHAADFELARKISEELRSQY